MITVAILDDHRVVVKSIKKLIDESQIAQVTDIYCDIKSCQAGLLKSLPDILLLDVELPDGDGVELCADLKKAYPTLKIIMLTSYREFNVAKRALYNGALGYIQKNAEPEEIIAGIETVYHGEQFLCKDTAILLKEKAKEEVVWFSRREKQILQMIADGLSNKEIACQLNREFETVKTYRRTLLAKFDVSNTAKMIKKACDQNLLK